MSPGLTALTDAPVDLDDKPNGLREAVRAHFSQQGGEWELRVQLCTDVDSMPVGDASVQWPEDQSPFVTVARLVAEPQTTWSAARAEAVDDCMAFTPWHALADHRPIGSIMRVRHAVYRMTAGFRSENNPTPVREPRELSALPD